MVNYFQGLVLLANCQHHLDSFLDDFSLEFLLRLDIILGQLLAPVNFA